MSFDFCKPCEIKGFGGINDRNLAIAKDDIMLSMCIIMPKYDRSDKKETPAAMDRDFCK